MKIKFIRDVKFMIQESVESMPYAASYNKNELEFIDILEEKSETLYIQFEDGSVGWIPKDSFNTME